VKCDVCERSITPEERNKRFKLGIICKACARQAKAEGKKIVVTDIQPGEVRTVEHLIDYIRSQLGVRSERYQADRIILRHCGYSLKDLVDTVNWCAREGKRINEPWKICYWVDYCLEHKDAEPIETERLGHYQQRVSDLYWTFTAAQKIKAMDAIMSEEAAAEFYRELQHQ
jgi:hypothetical protein